MRSFLLALVLFASAAHSLAQNPTETVQRDAQACADAMRTHDYEKTVALMPQRLINAMGGQATALATVKNAMESMSEGDATLAGVQLGKAGSVQKFGNWLICLVPETITMKVPGGHVDSQTYLIGISENDGKSWVFADSAAFTKENETQLAQMFPEFVGKLHIPEKKADVFKAD